MTAQLPEWWEWVDKDILISGKSDIPLRLIENAPEDVKKKFDKWKKIKEEEREKGIWK